MSDGCPLCGGSLRSASASQFLLSCDACSGTVVPRDASHAALPTSKSGVAEEIPLTDEFRRRYELIQLLGTGAMGVVYRGRKRVGGQGIAVKFLLHLDSEQHQRRFEKETQALLALEHPNVMALLAHGTVGGHPFLVSELLPGGTLRARIRPGQRGDPKQAQAITVEILSGLAACHDAGILHRDLKPENILFDEGGHAKLADLGLAKHYELEQVNLTATGAVVGTPLYMAPEQLFGEKASRSSDLYAVGLMFHEMLFGNVPLSGNTLPELLARRRTGRLDVPAKEVAPQIGQALQQLLALEPAGRPRSASEAIRLITSDGRVASRIMNRKAVTTTLTGAGDITAGAGGTAPPAASSRIAVVRPAAGRGRDLALLAAGAAGGLLLGWFARGATLSVRAVPSPAAPVSSASASASAETAFAPSVPSPSVPSPFAAASPAAPATSLVRGSGSAPSRATASASPPARLQLAASPASPSPSPPATARPRPAPSRARRSPPSPAPGPSLAASPAPSPSAPLVSALTSAPDLLAPPSFVAPEPPLLAIKTPALSVSQTTSGPAEVVAPATGQPAPSAGPTERRAPATPPPPLAVVDASSLVLPRAGNLLPSSFPSLLLHSPESGTTLSFLLPTPLSLEPGAVTVHANIMPAPDFDIVFEEGGQVLVRQSTHEYRRGVYWISFSDADRGTIHTRLGLRAADLPWYGSARTALTRVWELERHRIGGAPAWSPAVDRLAETMSTWTRTDGGAVLVVESVDYRGEGGHVDRTVGPIVDIIPQVLIPHR